MIKTETHNGHFPANHKHRLPEPSQDRQIVNDDLNAVKRFALRTNVQWTSEELEQSFGVMAFVENCKTTYVSERSFYDHFSYF